MAKPARSERDLWPVLTSAVAQAAQEFALSPYETFSTARIAAVFLWAALHDRSVNWACNPKHWAGVKAPVELPDQSTMSRRTRRQDFHRFLETVGRILNDQGPQEAGVLKLRRLDGKPLVIAGHSKDRDARFGYGWGKRSKGYKFHAVWGCRLMPEQWAVASLNVDEKHLARRFLQRLAGPGYLLVDTHYDANDLYDRGSYGGYQLVCPRQHPKADLGHHRQSRHRLRSLELLERAVFGLGQFGPVLYRQRKDIERQFGNLTSFGGGLMSLPAWVRRPWRVRNWVHAKLLINAARGLCLLAETQPLEAAA